MGTILTLARVFLRPFVLDGVPGSGINEPLKSDGLNAFAQIDGALASLAIFSAIGVAYPTLALLQADTTAAAGTPGLVFNDPTAANNGIYASSGAPATWAITPLSMPASWAALLTALQAACPWYATSWCFVSQLKAQLVAVGGNALGTVTAALSGEPTDPAEQQWTCGCICTPAGPLGTVVAGALAYSAGQMTELFAAAQALPF